MNSQTDRLRLLHRLWFDRTATQQELEEFSLLLRNADLDKELPVLLKDSWEIAKDDTLLDPELKNKMADLILSRYPSVDDSTQRPVHKLSFLKTIWFRYSTSPKLRWASAAAIIVILGSCAYLYFKIEKKDSLISAVTTVPQDISPGGDKALLTLSDGSTIVLDNAANGQLASQSGVEVIKKSNGELEYQTSGAMSNSGAHISYNTMKTPRGGQYQLRLPDGTRVWLNAASSITYPTSFTGKIRNVKIEGEVYFEVARDKTKPFQVDVNDLRIEVLGTNFNVNAYADESHLKATLLDGSIKVTNNSSDVILEPGQQASVTGNQKIQINKAVDVNGVIAWKNGYFNFNNADIPTIMRQLSRWYNIDVEYEGAIPDLRFNGEMGRSLNLSQVLKLLSETRIKYKLVGLRKIIILP